MLGMVAWQARLPQLARWLESAGSMPVLHWSHESAAWTWRDLQGCLPKLRLATIFMIIQWNFDYHLGFFLSLLSDRFHGATHPQPYP
jgi:hypothetical protein